MTIRGQRGRRRGFTFAEVMISLLILSMVGAGVASMLAMVSHGTSTQSETRRAAVQRRVVTGRLDGALRSSCRVLAVTGDAVVLWTGDARADGLPNLSELRRIEWQPGTNEFWSYAAMPDLPESRDRAFTLESNFDWITRRYRGSAMFPGTRWGRGITACNVSVDTADPAEARLVRYAITMGDDEASEATTTREVALRGRMP